MPLTLERFSQPASTQVLQLTPEDFLHKVKTLAQIPSLVEAIATRQVIQSTAKDMDIEVEPDELQASADMFRNMNQLQSAESTYLWLKQHQMSLEEFEELICGNVLYMKVAEHLFSDKIEPYFYEHQLLYEQAVMHEIIFDDEDLALEAFYSIKEKEITFSEVARQYIQDKDMGRKGGYRGALSRKELKPEISASVFAASPPTLLKPIMTAKGSHLIWVEELMPATLSEPLKIQIRAELFMGWLKQKTQGVEVEFISRESAKAD